MSSARPSEEHRVAEGGPVSRDIGIDQPSLETPTLQSDTAVSRDTPAASRQQRWREKLKEQGYEQKNVVLSPAWITRHQQPGESLLQLVLRACEALDHLVSVSRDTSVEPKNSVSRDSSVRVSRDTPSATEHLVSRDASRDTIINWIIVAKDAMRWSYQKIANTLNAQGIPTFSGKGTWAKGNVERFYKGKTD